MKSPVNNNHPIEFFDCTGDSMSRERNESQRLTSAEPAMSSSDSQLEEPVLPLILPYPRFFLWMPIVCLFFAASGLVSVVRGTSHGTFSIVLLAVFGVVLLLYVLSLQTVFTRDGIEQRSWNGRITRFGYLDIQTVEMGGSHGLALFISDTTGRRINVYGTISQLVVAQDLLRRRVPHAFKEA